MSWSLVDLALWLISPRLNSNVTILRVGKTKSEKRMGKSADAMLKKRKDIRNSVVKVQLHEDDAT